MNNYAIQPTVFGRWIIVSAADRTLAWTGARWRQHINGIPRGDAQICNFETEEDAERYAKEYTSVLGRV